MTKYGSTPPPPRTIANYLSVTIYAAVNVNPQGLQGILTVDNFSCQNSHLYVHFCVRIPPPIPLPHRWGLILYVLLLGLNSIHIPLGGMSVSSQNHQGCLWGGGARIQIDWCIKTVFSMLLIWSYTQV